MAESLLKATAVVRSLSKLLQESREVCRKLEWVTFDGRGLTGWILKRAGKLRCPECLGKYPTHHEGCKLKEILGLTEK